MFISEITSRSLLYAQEYCREKVINTAQNHVMWNPNAHTEVVLGTREGIKYASREGGLAIGGLLPYQPSYTICLTTFSFFYNGLPGSACAYLD